MIFIDDVEDSMADRDFNFDKFVQDIAKKEQLKKTKVEEKYEESPQRRYNRLYRELWQNRIVWKK
tara:strand:- start:855 stop:1049 length:195 start_codon:yes stop_codon:yes gene_type:complete